MNKRPIINRRLLATLATALLCLATAAQADKTTYYHNDALGSPVAATDENGDLLWSEEYGPWGGRQLREDNGENDLWYTGKQEEAGMGVHYFHARWYAPELGAFLSRDPAGARVDNLHSFNHYIYANNSPYRYTDPDGRIPIDTLFDVASAAIGLANMGRNIQEGNYGAAAADFAGVAVDSLAAAAPYVPGGVGIARAGVTKKAPDIATPYKRPSGATTKAQRESVQNKPCVDCGAATQKQVADHKTPLVREYYQTGTIDKTNMRSLDAVQPQCPTCSSRQGAEMSRYSRQQKKDLGL